MAEYQARILWRRNNEKFVDNRYSRGHLWEFDGGATVPASASPQVVPVPMAVEAHVDPEEAFVASLTSCHMLVFLSMAAKEGWVVDEYVDHAAGVMGENEEGRVAMTAVTLRPSVTFAGEQQPGREVLEQLHHSSHQECFIANSVKTRVVIEMA